MVFVTNSRLFKSSDPTSPPPPPPPPPTCPPHQFQCHPGANGHNGPNRHHRPNGPEPKPPRPHKPPMFRPGFPMKRRLSEPLVCIPEIKLCDGIFDCGAGNDEYGCPFLVERLSLSGACFH